MASPRPLAAPSAGGGTALSVVLCTHARPGYLRACLAGLAGQSHRDFEVLVVDSASPAAAAQAIASLAGEAGARLLRTDEPGLSRARNLGLAEAGGAWVAFLDDDAVPEPDWAAAMLDRIRALPGRAAALGGRILPAWEAPLPGWWPPSLRGVLTIIEWEGFGEVGVDLPEGVDIYGANMAFAAGPLREVGGFPETLGRVGDRLLSGEEVEVVAGLLVPDRGSLELGGRRLMDLRGRGLWVPPHRRRITLMAQHPLLLPHLDVLDNVAFGPRSAAVSPSPRRFSAAKAAITAPTASGIGPPARVAASSRHRALPSTLRRITSATSACRFGKYW